MIALGSMLFSRPEAAVEQRPAAETPAATSPVPAGPGVAADARTDDIQMYY
jgi:hypothetical protein